MIGRRAKDGRAAAVPVKVGIKDVAHRAGVSVGTVSNVINSPALVSEETRQRVRGAIAELGYVRSESARQLRAGRSRIVAMLVLDLANPFFAEVAKGSERAVRDVGLGVMVCNSAGSSSEEADYLSLFAEQRVRGVLLTPADNSGRAVESLRANGIPFVLVDRALPVEEGCSVSMDDVLGGTVAMRHLLESGHRRIAYIGGPAHLVQVRDRHAGAAAAIKAAGLPERALVHIETAHLDVASGREAGARLLGLTPRPTAVPLTSVRQPATRIGRSAAELLLAETGEDAADHVHQRIVLQPELAVRASSRSRRAAAS